MEIEGFTFSEDESPSDDSEDLSVNSMSSNFNDASLALGDKNLGGAVVINTSQIFESDPDENGPSINSFWLEKNCEDNNEVELKTEPEDRTEEIDTQFLTEATKKEFFDDEDFVRSDPDVNVESVLELDVSKSQSNTSISGTVTCSICFPKYTTLLYTDADLEAHNLHYHKPPIIPEKPFKCFYEGCEAVFKLRTPWGKASFQY